MLRTLTLTLSQWEREKRQPCFDETYTNANSDRCVYCLNALLNLCNLYNLWMWFGFAATPSLTVGLVPATSLQSNDAFSPLV